MRRAEIVTAIILGLCSLGLMWKSGEGPSWNPDIPRFANIGMIEGEGPGSGFWPFWLSLIMLICCCWIAYNWYRRTSPPSQSDEPFLDDYGKKMLLQVGGGLLGFLVVVHLAGFYGAMLIFMIYYMRFFGTARLDSNACDSGVSCRNQLLLFRHRHADCFAKGLSGTAVYPPIRHLSLMRVPRTTILNGRYHGRINRTI